MERILICSDIHLDVNNRLEDFTSSLDQIFSICKKERITDLYFGGDAFQRRRPHPLEQRIFERWIMKLVTELDIKILILIGNHDENAGVTTVDYFDILKVKNVKVVVSPHVVGDVYLGHHATSSSEMGPLGYTPSTDDIPVAELIKRYPDCKFYLLGHIHKPQTLNKVPFVGHIGSIERVDFAERDEQKRVLVIDENKKLKSVPLKLRPMIQHEVDISDGVAPLDGEPFKDAVVKILLKGSREDIKSFNEEVFITDVEKQAYSIKVAYEVTSKSRRRDTTINEGISFSDCFIAYSSQKKLPKKVIKKGLDIINEYS